MKEKFTIYQVTGSELMFAICSVLDEFASAKSHGQGYLEDLGIVECERALEILQTRKSDNYRIRHFLWWEIVTRHPFEKEKGQYLKIRKRRK